MKIYISGKISGLTTRERERNFKNADFQIWEEYGIDAYRNSINPLRLKAFLGIPTWFFFMIKDLWHLRKCTHILMLPNWLDSKGAVIEYFFAKFIFKLTVCKSKEKE